jgi:hypothetical protein
VSAALCCCTSSGTETGTCAAIASHEAGFRVWGCSGIVFDLAKCVVPKQFQDVVGYYNRFDVFELTVNRRALSPVRFKDEGEEVRGITPRPAQVEPSGEFVAGPSLSPNVSKLNEMLNRLTVW